MFFLPSTVLARFTRSGENQKLYFPEFVLFPIKSQSWFMVDVGVLSVSSCFPGRKVTIHSGSICVCTFVWLFFCGVSIFGFSRDPQHLPLGSQGTAYLKRVSKPYYLCEAEGHHGTSNLQTDQRRNQKYPKHAEHSLAMFLFCQEETPLLDSCAWNSNQKSLALDDFLMIVTQGHHHMTCRMRKLVYRTVVRMITLSDDPSAWHVQFTRHDYMTLCAGKRIWHLHWIAEIAKGLIWRMPGHCTQWA